MDRKGKAKVAPSRVLRSQTNASKQAEPPQDNDTPPTTQSEARPTNRPVGKLAVQVPDRIGTAYALPVYNKKFSNKTRLNSVPLGVVQIASLDSRPPPSVIVPGYAAVVQLSQQGTETRLADVFVKKVAVAMKNICTNGRDFSFNLEDAQWTSAKRGKHAMRHGLPMLNVPELLATPAIRKLMKTHDVHLLGYAVGGRESSHDIMWQAVLQKVRDILAARQQENAEAPLAAATLALLTPGDAAAGVGGPAAAAAAAAAGVGQAEGDAEPADAAAAGPDQDQVAAAAEQLQAVALEGGEVAAEEQAEGQAEVQAQVPPPLLAELEAVEASGWSEMEKRSAIADILHLDRAQHGKTWVVMVLTEKSANLPEGKQPSNKTNEALAGQMQKLQAVLGLMGAPFRVATTHTEKALGLVNLPERSAQQQGAAAGDADAADAGMEGAGDPDNAALPAVAEVEAAAAAAADVPAAEFREQLLDAAGIWCLTLALPKQVLQAGVGPPLTVPCQPRQDDIEVEVTVYVPGVDEEVEPFVMLLGAALDPGQRQYLWLRDNWGRPVRPGGVTAGMERLVEMFTSYTLVGAALQPNYSCNGRPVIRLELRAPQQQHAEPVGGA